MKHRVNTANPDWLTIIFFLFMVSPFIGIILGILPTLLLIPLRKWIPIYVFNITFNVTWIISTIIISFLIFLWILDKLKKSCYVEAISNAYRWSIKEALKTEYPHGVIYILENILQELDKFDLDWQPDSRYHNGKRYGFPNKTNLKETIKMARRLTEVWEQLDSYDSVKSSQAMAEIRGRIEQEDMYLWDNIKPLRNKNIYYFSYSQEDYEAEGSLNNLSKPNNATTKNNYTEESYYNNSSEQNDETFENNHTDQPYFNNAANNKLLSFQDWLDNNSALQYFSPEEQENAYQKYVQSIK